VTTRRRAAGALVAGAASPWLGAVAASPAPAPGSVPGHDPAGDPATLSLASRLRPHARAVVERLAVAHEDGLDPQDYGVPALREALGRLPMLADAGRFDAALLAALARFLRDLHDGRVDPRSIHEHYDGGAAAPFDTAAAIGRALAAQAPEAAWREAEPPLPQYAQLRRALAACRALAAHAAWDRPLPPLPRPVRRGAPAALEPGADWPGCEGLARRLRAWGDLDGIAADSPPGHYGPALAEAVRRFQGRHGLADDGVVGRATLAALEVAPLQRARQVELTMERLRWTPLRQAPRMIVVNLPEFVLRAYELQPDGRIAVRARMKVIVGRALDTRTPLFDELMRAIEFSPFWNVPPSIARKELVPRLRRDPGYFEREGFEFVDPAGQVLAATTPARLDAVLAGALRIRQRPGPRNALGDIKFVFPNRDGIYLHHTPATALFERDRRDFSHGCIRVEQPVELARFVLEGEGGWDEARIRQAMSAGTSTTLRLARPLPVLIAYGTALVRDGRLHCFEDVYGHDRLLDAALRQRRRPALPIP
jgi:murein L,D-transpeptidase YcbB/YkuD